MNALSEPGSASGEVPDPSLAEARTQLAHQRTTLSVAVVAVALIRTAVTHEVAAACLAFATAAVLVLPHAFARFDASHGWPGTRDSARRGRRPSLAGNVVRAVTCQTVALALVAGAQVLLSLRH